MAHPYRSRKKKMIMHVMRNLEGTYTKKSKCYERVERALEKLTTAEIDNLYCMIKSIQK